MGGADRLDRSAARWRGYVGTARSLDQARDKPDRHHDHGAEDDVAEHGLDRAEAEIVNPPQHHVDSVEDILRCDTQDGEYDADDQREHQEADDDAQHAAAKESVAVHPIVLPASGGGPVVAALYRVSPLA